MISNLIFKIINKFFKINEIKEEQKNLKILLGHSVLDKRKFDSTNINDYELKIFSQFGEDGIIDYLIKRLEIKNKYFIEFGVEDYDEANTRFLLEGKNWRGEIYEPNRKFVEKIKSQNYFWKFNLSVKNVFVTKNNINELIKNFISKFSIKNIGLISIDIDGVDYWIWEELKVINPDIVVIEYNSRLGSNDSLVVPYEDQFDRKRKHHSTIYFGASLNALYKLGLKKGYLLAGTNNNGSNAFFVKEEIAKQHNLKTFTPSECFNINTFNELRDEKGKLLERNIELENEILQKMKFIKI